jgi:hypothetical protein
VIEHECSDEKPQQLAKVFEVIANSYELKGVWLSDLNEGPDYESYEDSETGRVVARSEHESKIAWNEFGKDCRRIAHYLTTDSRFYL